MRYLGGLLPGLAALAVFALMREFSRSALADALIAGGVSPRFFSGLIMVGMLVTFMAVYMFNPLYPSGRRLWRKLTNKPAKRSRRNPWQQQPKRDFPLAPALLGVSLMTAAGIAGAYFYHRTPSVEASAPVQRLFGSDVFNCRVSSITDGDTLRCADGVRVRLNAVAARETDGTCSPGHPCPNASAQAATNKLTELAAGQTLECRQTGTSYGRKAAICINENGVEINCAMVRSGTAMIWPEYAQRNPICVY